MQIETRLLESRCSHQKPRITEVAAVVRRSLGIGGATMLLSLSSGAMALSTFGAVVELSELDGSGGFVINGIAGGESGYSVSSAGDINGDGVDDLIIGAPRANNFSGESYVVFGDGSVGSAGTIELSGLDGGDGFVINGIYESDSSGVSVGSAGDINGDGAHDLIIGAFRAGPNFSASGESYVVFGGGNVGSTGTLELSSLDGIDGFVIKGIADNDLSGRSVSSAGDVNGDGVADVVIGAFGADLSSGESYVVFGGGSVGVTGTLELSSLDGSNGFVIIGIDQGDLSGISVSSVGDVNGDEVDDLIIGAHRADPNGDSSGDSFIVFGGGSVGGAGMLELSSLDGSDGFVIHGTDAGDWSGRSVSGAGDVNGDGVADIIIGAPFADPNGNLSGESYVVFGDGSVGGSGMLELSSLDGSDGFVINGIDANDRSGRSVSSAGDVNGDGVDDLIVGAYGAYPNSNLRAGESYVVFGGGSVGGSGTIELSNLDGSDGFVMNGVDVLNDSGRSVSSAGDINGDGVDDLIIGARGARDNGLYSGASYVVYGRNVPQCNGKFVTVDLNFGESPGPNDDVVLGTSGNDDIRGRSGNDTICGEGGDDFIHGNSGNDWIDGGDGVDNIRGGQGNDILYAGGGATVGTTSIVFGGTGDDEIHGGDDADDLRGGRGIDTIYGNGGADVITGNADDDTINGGEGDDELRGGQGDDDVFGDAGEDFLSGGGGTADTCDGGSEMDTATLSCETVVDVP